MSWVAVAVAGGAVAGALIQSQGAKSAAAKQSQAGQNAIEEQAREFNISQEALQPYRAEGQLALSDMDKAFAPGGQLSKPFNFDMTQDPGYQFRLSEGLKGVESSAAAKGTQLSGATLKELTKYGQDYASGEFNAAFGRDLATKNQVYSMLMGRAGIGIGATTTGVQAGQQTAAGIANTMTGIGNVQAAGQIAGTNALGSAVSGIGSSYLLSQYLKPQPTQTTTAGPSLGGALDPSMAGPG